MLYNKVLYFGYSCRFLWNIDSWSSWISLYNLFLSLAEKTKFSNIYSYSDLLPFPANISVSVNRGSQTWDPWIIPNLPSPKPSHILLSCSCVSSLKNKLSITTIIFFLNLLVKWWVMKEFELSLLALTRPVHSSSYIVTCIWM